MKNSWLKKTVTYLLAACLMVASVSSLISCGEKYSAEIKWDVDLSKPIEMNLLFPDSGMPGFGSDHTAKLIEEGTGYKAKYTEVSDANSDNEINNILSTQAKYHAMKVSQAQYNPYVSTGGWLDLSELLTRTESGKLLYELIDLLPGAWESVSYTDANGKKGIYAIPECGYTANEDFAFVWNNEHLKQIGWFNNHTDVPSTIGELTEAFAALQAKFGATNKNYHALGLGGANSSNVENIMAAFGCADQFYIDENGKVQMYVYDESVTKYVQYMNNLAQTSVLSDSWQGSNYADICSKFATETNSVVFLPYWWVTPLCNAAVSNKMASKYGKENNYNVVHDDIIKWKTRIRGDGTSGSENQTAAKHIYPPAGNAYYVTIPYYMAEDAVYIIDYMAKKLANYALWYGGKEGIDWIEVAAPTDGKENYKEKIVFLKAWSYEAGGKTVTGGGKWVQLTKNYTDSIVNNSMYASGANPIEARALFHLRETGFDAWQVAVPTDENSITNPITLHPTFKWWSPISILARTTAKRGIASAIDATDAEKSLNLTRNSLKTRSAKVNGVTYHYWSDNIVNEMTAWYNAKPKSN